MIFLNKYVIIPTITFCVTQNCKNFIAIYITFSHIFYNIRIFIIAMCSPNDACN